MGVSIYNTAERDSILTNAMQHKGSYNGGSYKPGDVVVDGEWVMCANKDTADRAAPQPLGSPETPLAAWTPLVNSHFGVVHSGHEYVFTQGGWIQQVRIWVPELTGNTNYRVLLADLTNPAVPIYTAIEEPVLIENQWNVIRSGSTVVPAGSVLRIMLDALNSSGSTDFSDGWTYQGTNNTEATPGIASWNTNVQQDLLRIEKQSLGGDYSTQLAGIVAGSSMSFVSTLSPVNYLNFLTTGTPTDLGTYFSVPVVLNSSSGNVPVATATTADISIPVPLDTEYNIEASGWITDPTWGTVEGILELDGTPQPGNEDNAFGVDITFQPASISEDWNFVSYNG